MKRLFLLLNILSILFSLTSCIITDDELDPAIRNKFEIERVENDNSFDSSVKDSYLESCLVEFGESCVLPSQCAVIIKILGTSTGFKYFYSENQYSEAEVRKQMRTIDYIEGAEYNFAQSYTYQSNGKPIYLYTAGYLKDDDNLFYGPIQVKELIKPQGNGFYQWLVISDIKKSHDSINWTIGSSGYNFYYLILTNEDAEYAKSLSSAEIWLYKRNEWKSTIPNNYGIREFEIDSENVVEVFIACRAVSGTEYSSAIVTKYQKFLN